MVCLQWGLPVVCETCVVLRVLVAHGGAHSVWDITGAWGALKVFGMAVLRVPEVQEEPGLLGVPVKLGVHVLHAAPTPWLPCLMAAAPLKPLGAITVLWHCPAGDRMAFPPRSSMCCIALSAHPCSLLPLLSPCPPGALLWGWLGRLLGCCLPRPSTQLRWTNTHLRALWPHSAGDERQLSRALLTHSPSCQPQPGSLIAVRRQSSDFIHIWHWIALLPSTAPGCIGGRCKGCPWDKDVGPQGPVPLLAHMATLLGGDCSPRPHHDPQANPRLRLGGSLKQ